MQKTSTKLATRVAILGAGFLSCVATILAALPLGMAPLALGIDAPPKAKTLDEQLAESLANINTRLAKVSEVEKAVAENKKAYEELTVTVGDVKKALDEFRRLQISARTLRVSGPARKGHVSDEAARAIGAVALTLAHKQGKLSEGLVDFTAGVFKEMMGFEMKAALTSGDIPLPVGYSGEVVELISQYGSARQYGTVYPLGNGTVNLPRLKTSPAFGLIAQSAAIGEKSPQTEWVAFAAKKWGGIIRLPSELDEDSIIALGQFIARYAAREMAKIEDIVFWAADGSATYGTLEGLLIQADDLGKVVDLAATKEKYSDVLLANVREMRSLVATPALSMGAYFFHPTFEQHFAGFNTAGDKPYVANGVNGASLDGFPIRWVDTLPAFSKTNNPEKVFGAFGDPTYHYLGARGGIRFDTSTEAAFTTDETLVRALERFTTGLMADDAVSVIKTGTAA